MRTLIISIYKAGFNQSFLLTFYILCDNIGGKPKEGLVMDMNDIPEIIIEPREGEQKKDEARTDMVASNIIDEEGILPFERMDFNNPVTIMHYGNDIIKGLKTKIEEIQKLSNNEKVNNVRLENNIKNLTTFADNKNQKMLEAPKAIKETGLFKVLKRARNKALEAREEVIAKTEQEVTEEFIKQIDEVASDLEKQKNNTINRIKLNNELKDRIKPYVKTLDYAYRIGLKQRDEYEQTVVKVLEKQYNENPNSLLKKQLDTAKSLLALADAAITKTQKSAIMGKARIERIKTNVNSDMLMVVKYNDMIDHDLEESKIDAREAVENIFRTIRAEQQEMLIKSINEMAVKNSEAAKNNALKVVEILSKGTIYTETIETVFENVKNAREAIDTINETVQERALQDRDDMLQISDALSEFNENMESIIDTQKFIDEHPITHDHRVTKKFTPKRKKEVE